MFGNQVIVQVFEESKGRSIPAMELVNKYYIIISISIPVRQERHVIDLESCFFVFFLITWKERQKDRMNERMNEWSPLF